MDWVLRLERQADFCEFEAAQRKEELLQAVLIRSIPEISDKLYEMSDLFGNDLDRILAHGKHLDYIRSETEEEKQVPKEEKGSGIPEQVADEGMVVKPVYGVRAHDRSLGPIRRVPFQGSRSGEKVTPRFQAERRFNKRDERNCYRCGEIHRWNQCKAYRVTCYKCQKVGHFAECCLSNSNSGSEQQVRWGRNEDRVSKINQVK